MALVTTSIVSVSTSVTVAEVDLERMSSADLIDYSRSKWEGFARFQIAADRRLSELMPALRELERRYKKPGARTDLKDCPPGLYDVLELIGINPGSFRVVRRREALRQLEAMVVPSTPGPVLIARKRVTPEQKLLEQAKAEFGRAAEGGSESAKAILADYEEKAAASSQDRDTDSLIDAGIKLARAILAKRTAQAMKLAEQLLKDAGLMPVTIEAAPVRVSLPVCHQKVVRDGTEPVAKVDYLKGSVVKEIDYQTAAEFIERYEYLGNCGSSRWQYGLYLGEHLAAVECFGSTSGTYTGVSAVGEEYADKVVTLVRGAHDGSHPHAASYLISHACREMAKKGKCVFVAYSDERAGEIGTVYQASSWLYTGKTATPTMYRAPDGTLADSRMVSALCRDRRGCEQNGKPNYHMPRAQMKAILEERGYKVERGESKHRYINFAGSDTMKRKLRKALRWPVLPYIKRVTTEN